MYKQVIPENIGITDVVEDRSEKHKGFLYHSSFDFNHETIGTFHKVINKMVEDRPYGTMVEVGCGSSIIAQYLPNTMTYVGLDGNQDSGVFARELGREDRVSLVLDLTEEFRIEPELQGDFLISFDFYEHMEPDKIDYVIQKSENLLARGGKAFLIIDTIPGDTHLIIESKEWWLGKFAMNAPSWRYYEDPNFMDLYWQNVPPHWSFQAKQQHTFLFRRDI